MKVNTHIFPVMSMHILYVLEFNVRRHTHQETIETMLQPRRCPKSLSMFYFHTIYNDHVCVCSISVSLESSSWKSTVGTLHHTDPTIITGQDIKWQ